MVSVVLYIIPTIFVLYTLRKARERLWGRCKNNVKLDNKVAVVTGANSGIGFEIAKELAARNAHVIVACRSLEASKNSIGRIEAELKQPILMTPMEVDLSSLKSVQEFAENLLKSHQQIHILINNAGVAFPKRQIHKSTDNLEIHFAVNHLSHFLLTKLLITALKNAKHSRIITVSSKLHENGTIDFENFNEGVKNTHLYADSKLANVYFSRELAKKVSKDGINVYCICPGWVYTSLFRHSFKWYHYILIAPIAYLFMRSPHQGAQTAIYCATEPDLGKETGLIYRDCSPYISKTQLNDDISLKLWAQSEKLIKEIL